MSAADSPTPAKSPAEDAAAPAALADQLRALLDGLLLLSESEAPLTVVTLPKEAIVPDALRELAHLPPDAPAEEWLLADALGEFATPADDSAAAKADAARWQQILDFCQQQLTHASVWKLGADPKKPWFLIGRQPDRAWLGAQSEVVET